MPDAGKMKAMSDAVVDLAESILRFAHVDMKPTLAGQTAFVQTQVKCNIDFAVVTALLKPPKRGEQAEFEEALKSEVAAVLLRLKQMAPAAKFPPLPSPLTDADLDVRPAEAPSVMDNETAILPKVIRYDVNGVPLDKQDKIEVVAIASCEDVPWRVW